MRKRDSRTKRAILTSRNTKVKPVYPKPHILYRHILRQASHLSDPASQYFFQTTARQEFRRTNTQDSNDKRLNMAMSNLIKLTRANIGHPLGLEYVVGLTYGFAGPVIKQRAIYASKLEFFPEKLSRLNYEKFRPFQYGVKSSPAYPVHPRVLLSFESDVEPFRQSLLYHLKDQPPDVRKVYRKWPDFGFIPIHDEDYHRLFPPLSASTSASNDIPDGLSQQHRGGNNIDHNNENTARQKKIPLSVTGSTHSGSNIHQQHASRSDVEPELESIIAFDDSVTKSSSK